MSTNHQPVLRHVPDDIKERIRQVYSRAGTTRGYAKKLADELGWSRHDVYRVARSLDVQDPHCKPLKCRRWTAPELDLLESTGHLSPAKAAQEFSRAGHLRSAYAIHNKRAQQGIKVREEKISEGHYTCYTLADHMGVDRRTVSRWIRNGYLRATPTVTGEPFQIDRAAIRQFVVNHVALLNMANIDKYWLVDLLCRRGI